MLNDLVIERSVQHWGKRPSNIGRWLGAVVDIHLCCNVQHFCSLTVRTFVDRFTRLSLFLLLRPVNVLCKLGAEFPVQLIVVLLLPNAVKPCKRVL